jgi:hypothetical protein
MSESVASNLAMILNLLLRPYEKWIYNPILLYHNIILYITYHSTNVTKRKQSSFHQQVFKHLTMTNVVQNMYCNVQKLLNKIQKMHCVYKKLLNKFSKDGLHIRQ